MRDSQLALIQIGEYSEVITEGLGHVLFDVHIRQNGRAANIVLTCGIRCFGQRRDSAMDTT